MMEIIKHGDLKPRHFICDGCGCEFIADMSEYTITYKGTAFINCPECNKFCNQSTPYKDSNTKLIKEK